MHSRAAKNNALRAIKSSNNSEHNEDAEVEFIDTENDNEGDSVPMYSQNAPEGRSLDLFKQYKSQKTCRIL